MKVLLDSCIRGSVAAELNAAGYDAQWVGDWPEDPGDEALLAEACSEERVLVTLDKDFGELAVARGLPHHGIIRLVNVSAKTQGNYCLNVLAQHATELQAGAIVTVEPGRIRIRN